jgi:hypothetical protein
MPKPTTQLTTVPSEDALMGAQLTTQYHRATGGMKEVVIFGAMMMQLREKYPELAQKGGDRKSKSTRGLRSEEELMTLSQWLEIHAPEVKRTTAIRFLNVTAAIAEDYAQIVGPKVAKLMPLSQLVTTPFEELPQNCAAKQLELFEWVNGTSQRSWLDRFSPDSPQKRGAANRTPTTPRPPTAEELASIAEEEITTLLNHLDGWFAALHHTRVKKGLRDTAIACFEDAQDKLKAL